jgi:hypothetical protein
MLLLPVAPRSTRLTAALGVIWVGRCVLRQARLGVDDVAAETSARFLVRES